MFKWIKCSEQMPINLTWVLCCNAGYHGAELCWFENNEFFIKHKNKWNKTYLQDGCKSKPTHWLYLPCSPEIENDRQD
jgi:hypothetical protein